MSCATSSHDQTCRADGKSVESVKGMVPGSGSTAGLRIDVSSQGSKWQQANANMVNLPDFDAHQGMTNHTETTDTTVLSPALQSITVRTNM